MKEQIEALRITHHGVHDYDIGYNHAIDDVLRLFLPKERTSPSFTEVFNNTKYTGIIDHDKSVLIPFEAKEETVSRIELIERKIY